MKLNYIIALLCLIFLGGCAKDKGNYDYAEVNKMTVVNAEGENINAKTYDLMYGESLTLAMKSTGTLPSFDPAKVVYTWILDKDTVATGAEATFSAENLSPGENQLLLYAKDPTNGLDMMTFVRINLSASISKGFFILTADAANNTNVYFRSSLNPQANPYLVPNFGIDKDIKLGKNPIEINPIYYDRRYTGINVFTGQGEHVFYQFDLQTLAPTRSLVGSNKALDGGNLSISAYKPYVQSQDGSGFVIDKGQLRYFGDGFLQDNAIIDPTFKYNLGKGNFVASEFSRSKGTLVMAFDELSKRVLVFEYDGRVINRFRAPNLSLASDQLEGMTYLGSGGNSQIDGTINTSYYTLLRKGNAVYSYTTAAMQNPGTGIFEAQKVRLLASGNIPNIEKAVDVRHFRWTNVFYFAIGRTIYRMLPNSIDARAFITLPDDGTGDIVSWNFDVESFRTLSNFGIATYNAASTEKNKGSLYHYTLAKEGEATGPVLVSKDLYKIDKTVSIGVAVQ